MGNVEYKTKRMAGRWKRTVTCLLAPLLLAACAPLGRQPTVESEVIDPAGAAELYGAAALPDCENRIAYTLLGESEPAAASDAWPGESEMDWDAALRRAMTLRLYAGADTAGNWQLLYYPQALAERSGMRPFYEAYCEQDGLLLDVRFDSTTGALLWWAAEPGAGYWARFTLLWALKESRAKQSGAGLRGAISQIPVPLPEGGERLFQLDGLWFRCYQGEGWRGAVCALAPPPEDIVWLPLDGAAP